MVCFNKVSRRVFSTLGAVAVVGVFATAWAGFDYSKLPEDPAETSKQLASLKVTLTQATAQAEKESGGRTSKAVFRKDPKPAYEIRVCGSKGCWDYVIDAKTGATLSKEQARRWPGDPVSGKWVETESGLKYYDIKVGTGEKPKGSAVRVEVHYSGWLVDGKEFDSSVARGKPAQFPLNGVIRGWTEGVGSMKVGGKRKLIIPHDLGYGAGGHGQLIPPRATLIFDVELLRILP